MTTTADPSERPADGRWFRHSRVGLDLAFFYAVVYFALGARRAAVMFGTAWPAVVLSALWVALGSFRNGLFLASDMVLQQGIIRSKTVPGEDVIQIKWRNWPFHGSIIVRTRLEKVTINLADFTKADREEIIRYFRETFAEEIQERWLYFGKFGWHL